MDFLSFDDFGLEDILLMEPNTPHLSKNQGSLDNTFVQILSAASSPSAYPTTSMSPIAQMLSQQQVQSQPQMLSLQNQQQQGFFNILPQESLNLQWYQTPQATFSPQPVMYQQSSPIPQATMIPQTPSNFASFFAQPQQMLAPAEVTPQVLSPPVAPSKPATPIRTEQVKPASADSSKKVWKTLHTDKALFQEEKETAPFVVLIKARRGEKVASDEISDCLFSSIKYELTLKLKQSCLKIDAKKSKFLTVKLQVVDAKSPSTEIKKDGSKSIVDGTSEATVSTSTKSKTGYLDANLRLQFNDVSYHHGNKEFAFRVSVFDEHNPQEPFLVKLSNSFLVRARKPKENAPKRKRNSKPNEDEEDEEQPAAKVQKTQATSSTSLSITEEYDQRLLGLLACLQQMDEKSRQDALSKTIKSLATLFGLSQSH